MTAQPITCDTGNDNNLAVMLITNLQGGSVMGLCPLCVPDYLDGVSKAFRDALAPQPAAEQPAADVDATGEGTQTRARPRKRKADTQDVPAGSDDLAAQLAAADASAD